LAKAREIKARFQNLKAEQTTLTNDIAALDAQINTQSPPPGNLDALSLTRKTKQDRLNLIGMQIAELEKSLGTKRV